MHDWRDGFVRLARRGALLCLLGLLCACASLRWQKPEVSVEGARILGGNLMETRVLLSLSVRNPNARELELDSIRFDMLVGEDVLASGLRAQPVRIAQQGQTPVDIEVRLRSLELLRHLAAALQADGTLPYTLRGEAEVRGFGRQPFVQQARLVVPKAFQSK